MAHTGSEVERALAWKEKGRMDYCAKASERAFELLDLTLACPANTARLKEIARVREALADFFWGSNRYAGTASGWRAYFFQFAKAARRGR